MEPTAMVTKLLHSYWARGSSSETLCIRTQQPLGGKDAYCCIGSIKFETALRSFSIAQVELFQHGSVTITEAREVASRRISRSSSSGGNVPAKLKATCVPRTTTMRRVITQNAVISL